MRATARSIACAALLAWSLVAPRATAAGPSDACFDAYERAQRLRKEGHLRATQEKLLVCAAATCPTFVSRDCTQWSREVERIQPRVVFGAKDERGGDLAAVEVSVDGEKIVRSLDGRAVPLDPGRHAVRYQWGARAMDLEIVLGEGELRRLDAQFKGPTAATAPTPTPTPEQAPPRSAGAPVTTWVLGGVAVAAGAVFAGFALAGKNKEGCAPQCSDAEIATLRRDYLIADVSLLVGIAAIGGALYFWLTRDPAPAAPAPDPATRGASDFALRLAPVVGGATLGTVMRF
jgi:hypothetical protein